MMTHPDILNNKNDTVQMIKGTKPEVEAVMYGSDPLFRTERFIPLAVGSATSRQPSQGTASGAGT